MGMDLTNGKGECQRFNNHSWSRILELAHSNGWEPIGTVIQVRTNEPKVIGHEIRPVTRRDELFFDEIEEYTEEQLNEVVGRRKVEIYDPEFVPEYEIDKEFNYFSNDGQLVTAEDALAIADALDKAVKELPAPRVEPVSDFSQERIYGRMADEIQRFIAECSSGNVARMPVTNEEPTVLEFWSRSPERVIEFAEFCTHGEFEIY